MAERVSATFRGGDVACPLCGSRVFSTKEYCVAGKWLQVFDCEGFASVGIMLICCKCAYILHFASADAIETQDI